MKPFTKQEIIGVGLIFLFLTIVTYFNLQISIRKARDAQRRADLGAISDALNDYQAQLGFYPPSEDGKIKACKANNFEEIIGKLQKDPNSVKEGVFATMRACEWGKDSLRDIFNESYQAYLTIIPQDPKEGEGTKYLYFSNTRMFQIYAYLEGEESEVGYNKGIVSRNLNCGNKICNFGKSSGETPLDKSLEEYEIEILQKSQSGI